jgi:hypothetical protein
VSALKGSSRKRKLAILVAVILVIGAAIAFESYRTMDSRPNLTKMQLKALQQDVEKFKQICGRLPESSEWYQDFLTQDCFKSIRDGGWQGMNFQYSKPPKDSWGNPIRYVSDSGHKFLVSAGTDGQFAGHPGDSDDIAVEIE